MKILYIVNPKDSVELSGFYNDYMSDVLFHGLYNLPDVEIIEPFPMTHLFKPLKSYVDPKRIYGHGFSSCFTIDDDPKDRDRDNIDQKIQDHYYDYIIYGSICRTQSGLKTLMDIYDHNKIILIDGEDGLNDERHPNMTLIHQYNERYLELSTQFPNYFKRELRPEYLEKYPNLKPISFAIPESKIRDKINPIKHLQKIATPIPYSTSTYQFTDEQEYYDNYYNSDFGITMQKAGWDCMRHYEIMANGCIPLFFNFENRFPHTLTTLDPDLMNKCWATAQFGNDDNIIEMKEEVLEFTKNNLTTKHLAQYVLETIA